MIRVSEFRSIAAERLLAKLAKLAFRQNTFQTLLIITWHLELLKVAIFKSSKCLLMPRKFNRFCHRRLYFGTHCIAK
jgi:hypothetical protein